MFDWLLTDTTFLWKVDKVSSTAFLLHNFVDKHISVFWNLKSQI